MPHLDDKSFPFKGTKPRLEDYDVFDKVFLGQHFDAFNIKVKDQKWSKSYQRLKFVVANFAGLVSKVSADMLFSEPPTFTTDEKVQPWLDAVIGHKENKLHIQNYESALSNSALGDALYKIRVGKRHSRDKDMSLIIEDTTPTIWFPELNMGNTRQNPETEILAWKIKVEIDKQSKDVVRMEIHEPGKIINKAFLLEGGKLKKEIELSEVEKNPPEKEVNTKTDFNWLYHTPNWKKGSTFFGLSDYVDLMSLFFSLDNRMTKVDNILDKHSDPILALPEGILDEKGKVKRGNLHMFEKPQGSDEKPEYVVWNASLESAFSEIDKLVEFLFMFSEISPDVLGMGKGQADSGRALKFKLIRTIGKIRRKRVYYDDTLKQLLFDAQVVAKEHGIKVQGIAAPKTPADIEIEWQDGLPLDEREQVEIEEMRVNSGLTTEAEAISRIDGISIEEAEKKVAEKEKKDRLSFEAGKFDNVKDVKNKDKEKDE